MKKLFRKQINNLALKKKLLLPIVVILFALAAVALVSLEYVNRANQDLLYRSVSSSMEYLSFSIERELDTYVDLSLKILSDSSVQNILSRIKDSDGKDYSLIYTEYNSRLKTILENFYYDNTMKNLQYITLQNQVFTSSTYNMRSSRVPESVKEELKQRAEEANGRPVWVTDYAKEYGLLLVRSVRRIDELRLDDLGVIVLAIDVRRMVEETMEKISLSDDLLYALYNQEESVFLCPSEMENEKMTDLLRSLSGNYGVVQTGHGDYFVSKGAIGEYSWGYSFWVSYDDIMQKLNVVKMLCILMILICVVCFTVIADRLVSSITSHFNRLINKMIAFGQDDSRLPEADYDYSERKDEIGRLHNQFDSMANQIINLINENYKNELLKKDMELKALQNQINPHFLYNTLNYIHWKAKADREEEIAKMVQALGKLLRASLNTRDEKNNTIGRELEIVRNYIIIVQIRFQDQLRYTEHVEQEALKTWIPLMIIQPIVENAVNYGLEESIDGCEVSLDVYSEGADVIIQVVNNGTQFGADFMNKLQSGGIAVRGLGIGMQNIHKRILMTFGENYGLSVCDPDADHAMVQIRIPGNSEMMTDSDFRR